MKTNTLTTRLLALLACLALALPLVACGTKADATDVATAAMTDRAGNPITLPESVERIITMAPATTEVLLDLGLAESIVAVDDESAWMFAEGLAADVAVFELMNPDIEQTLALSPDIIFISPLTAAGGDDPYAAVIENGVCVATIPTPDTLSGIVADVQFIGQCVGKAQQAEDLAADIAAAVDEVSGIAGDVSEKRTVLFEISAVPYIYSFGQGVYLHEVLELVGAENVFADQTDWIPVSEEDAIAANPDVILTNVNYIDDAVGEILGREGWGSVSAVANGDVYYVDNAASSLPNHKVASAIREIAKAVYPDVYEDL